MKPKKRTASDFFDCNSKNNKTPLKRKVQDERMYATDFLQSNNNQVVYEIKLPTSLNRPNVASQVFSGEVKVDN